MKTPTSPPPQFIARQVALGFGSVSVVAIAMCAMLLTVIYDVSGLIAGMRQGEEPIRQGRELATSVRELSIHIAHSLLEGDASHLDHYEEWRERVLLRSHSLLGQTPKAERWRLPALLKATEQMDTLLKTVALPAARRGDASAAREVHLELENLGKEVAAHADALATATSSQMEHSHVLATRSTRLGLAASGLCVVLVLGLSIGFTLRLRAAVLKPLVVLTKAARRFGRGEFDSRIGNVGNGELAELGNAMDHMANELSRREARLLRTERMAVLGQLAAGVAHELNNPIGIMRGYLKMMTPHGDPDVLAEELAILDEEAGHCQRIAEELLSYARSGELTLQVVEMGPFLTELGNRFGDSIEGQHRALIVEVGDARLQADTTRLRQLLFNLLNNAIQASPDGAAVKLRGTLSDSEYVIEIEDQGPGIAPECREQVFEPFFSTRAEGSGLGLSICLAIVRAHHGHINVGTTSQGGSVLKVQLPLVQPEVTTRNSESPA